MKKKPTLSIYMANYNHSRFLKYSVNAVLEQSYQPVEFIILDDCSTDDSLKIFESLAAENPGIRIIRHEKNKGAFYSFNKLLRMCKGDYIYGVAADDVILPGFLEKTMAMFEKHPEAAYCSTLSILLGENGENLGICPTPVVSTKSEYFPPDESFRLIRDYGSWVMGNSVAYHKKRLLAAGGFDPKLGSFSDGFIHMVLALRHGACYIPIPLAAWRRLDGGIAASTKSDGKLWLENKRRAAGLMRTEHSDLFPADFISYYERQQLFRALISAKGAKEKREYLSEVISIIYDKSKLAKFGWTGILNFTVLLRRFLDRFVSFLKFQLSRFKSTLRTS
ncbi:MAG: glycosyltransferase family 2 protein [Candidatus Marinimicrobia bacterium]|nr:glycosyltransferase family 2 protein [Candidatus Neomarinimicrobiota bacterium]